MRGARWTAVALLAGHSVDAFAARYSYVTPDVVVALFGLATLALLVVGVWKLARNPGRFRATPSRLWGVWIASCILGGVVTAVMGGRGGAWVGLTMVFYAILHIVSGLLFPAEQRTDEPRSHGDR